MRILLDTHILIWWMQNNPKLSKKAQQLLADPANLIFISAASIWELRIKQSLGRIDLPAKFDSSLHQLSFEELSVSIAHTEELRRLPRLHSDPFDRMLLAQARAEKLSLLSADTQLIAYGYPVISS